MNCPQCGKEMTKGRMENTSLAPKAARFKEDRRRASTLLFFEDGFGIIVPAGNNEAYYCRGCRKLVFAVDIKPD